MNVVYDLRNLLKIVGFFHCEFANFADIYAVFTVSIPYPSRSQWLSFLRLLFRPAKQHNF